MRNKALNLKETSIILNMSKASVLTLIKTGKLKRLEGFRDIVIMLDDIMRYVQNNSVQTTLNGFYEDGFLIYKSKL